MPGPAISVVLGGFFLAFVFGAVANRSNYCIMGAISDAVNMGHYGRIRMWLLALAVAMLGANLLYFFGLVDLSKTLYLRPAVPWLSLVLGGFLFGIGMTISAGCVNKNLVRLGGGSLRSLVVLVFLAISAYMTLKGLFAPWRSTYLDRVTIDTAAIGMQGPGLGSLLGAPTGMSSSTAALGAALVVAICLLVFVFSDSRFRSNLLQVAAGAVLGLLIVAGWYLSGHIGYGENPETLEMVYFATNSRTLESLSYVAPTAYGLEMLMLWTDNSLKISFGVASALGVVLGSFAMALGTRQFRLEGFASAKDMYTQLGGAVLMGFGGITALGCTIGQGLSGLSTLSLGSVLAVAGVVAGSVATLKFLQS